MLLTHLAVKVRAGLNPAQVVNRVLSPIFNKMWGQVLLAWVEWVRQSDLHRKYAFDLSEDGTRILANETTYKRRCAAAVGATTRVIADAKRFGWVPAFRVTQYDPQIGSVFFVELLFDGKVEGRGAASNLEMARRFAALSADAYSRRLRDERHKR
jgi:hypothetical protein